jgi:hypothetical protein
MKNLLFCAALLMCSFQSFAQTECDYGQDEVPQELMRKRLKDNEPGFKYGGPYTMFNRIQTVGASMVC